MNKRLDTSDPGKAANVAARAAILYARTCGMVAENTWRQKIDDAALYGLDAFEAAIAECFPELQTECADVGYCESCEKAFPPEALQYTPYDEGVTLCAECAEQLADECRQRGDQS